MLAPDPSGSGVDIFDHQINRALNQAKALQFAHGQDELAKNEAIRADRLDAVKKACNSLTAHERAELVRWLAGGASE
jgi:hypothetical protein